MLTFAFMHYPYLVCILFGMPSLHLFTFLMFLKSCRPIGTRLCVIFEHTHCTFPAVAPSALPVTPPTSYTRHQGDCTPPSNRKTYRYTSYNCQNVTTYSYKYWVTLALTTVNIVSKFGSGNYEHKVESNKQSLILLKPCMLSLSCVLLIGFQSFIVHVL